jgi:hypothetical protein
MKTLLENVNQVAKGFSGDDPEGLSLRARELAGNFSGNGANSLGGSLKAVADAFAKLFTTITEDGDESTSTLQTFANALESVANGINAITRAYGKVVALGDKFRASLVGQFVYAEGKFAPENAPGRAAGGSVMGGQPYRVGEFGPELFVPNGSGSIRPDNGAGQGVTIIMNGVIDGESARRSIERLLQDSSRRTGAVNLVGATL